jgi:hypothetical protein
MMMDRIKISLVCISAYFFWMLIIIVSSVIFYANVQFRLLLISQILSIVSLFGSLLFLIEIREKSNRWYLGIPFFVAILVLSVSNLLIYFNGKYVFSDPISTLDTIWFASSMALAPCAALLLYSMPKNQLTNHYMPLTTSIMVGIFAIVFLLLVLREILSYSSMEGSIALVLLYYYIGMPIIGICFWAIVLRYKSTDDVGKIKPAV